MGTPRYSLPSTGLWGMCTILCTAPILLFMNFAASVNPIERHITLEPLPEQEGVKEIVIVVVVGDTNTAVCGRCDQKGVEEGGYDRADGCNALMPRLGRRRRRMCQRIERTRTD